uniref:Uncharacterized protein n=1 Tax=Vespula pensylvanica TaxID=30213 RepID=A0A834NZC0_VESPE|nr:hypothetical protein H0235_009780 [Vespula pensylvanica]
MHILSAGILMYTSDLRFLVIHPENSENWTLQIKSPQERDSGVYECQVSTEPKMSLNYTLNVVGLCQGNVTAATTADADADADAASILATRRVAQAQNEKKVTEDSSSDENFSDFVAQESEESLEKKKIMPDMSDVGKSTAVHRNRTTGFDV